MRIVILTQYYPPEIGAPQSRLLELANGFTRSGWDVHVVTALPNYPKGRVFDGYRSSVFRKEVIGQIPVSRYWLYPSNSKRTLPRIMSMISFAVTSLLSLPHLLRLKPDFIFVESPPLALAGSGLILAKLCRAKMIMNVSDIWPLTARELGALSDGVIYRCLERMERFLYKHAFLCTGQSQEIVDHISKINISPAMLFRNGVDHKRFVKSRPASQRSTPRLVYAGLLGVAQGIEGICRSVNFQELGTELHIYGSGAERAEIELFLSNEPGRGIFLHDPVSRDEMPDILAAYDGALIPLAERIYGAVPSKIYEAMAAGLPIVFYGDGEAAGIVIENQVGWTVPTGDVTQLKKSIVEFGRDSHRRAEYSENGSRAAREIYDREIQIQALHERLTSKTEISQPAGCSVARDEARSDGEPASQVRAILP